MVTFSRRKFLIATMGAPLATICKPPGQVMTVNGMIPSSRLGTTLAHEHVLVDFIGADHINEKRWDKIEVVERVSPFILEARSLGLKTLVECTPAFLGRDARLLKMLSDKTAINIITNTGYYGAIENKYLPRWAITETAEQLSGRWADDFEYGIDGTTVRPGFIKTSVDASPSGLSDVHKKLVRAAALTHLKTGLVIYSHTGLSGAALEQLAILKSEKVHPGAFVWVHAQAEKDKSMHSQIAKMGAWVSLDNIGENLDDYIDSIGRLKDQGLLHRLLISHDAGYYRPGEENGGDFRGYTDIFKALIPRLKSKGFSKKDLDTLLKKNPCEALELKIRKI